MSARSTWKYWRGAGADGGALMVSLADEEARQVLNILVQTREFAWVVTNPLILRIGQQLQGPQGGPVTTGLEPGTVPGHVPGQSLPGNGPA